VPIIGSGESAKGDRHLKQQSAWANREKGSVISQKSLATLIAHIIEAPDEHIREDLGVNKPNT